MGAIIYSINSKSCKNSESRRRKNGKETVSDRIKKASGHDD